MDVGLLVLGSGFAGREGVSRYRARYPFPAPIRPAAGGRPLLWVRQDVEAWLEAQRTTGGGPRRNRLS